MSARAAGGEGGVPVFAGGGVKSTGSIATEFCPNVFQLCQRVDSMGMELRGGRALPATRGLLAGILFL
jgi:hypothetical protein